MKKLILVALFLSGCAPHYVVDSFNTNVYAPSETYAPVHTSMHYQVEYFGDISAKYRKDKQEARQTEREKVKKTTIQVIPR